MLNKIRQYSMPVVAIMFIFNILALHSVNAQTSDLMVAGPLGEMTLGDPSAPVTIIEYASATCGHCANFHKTTFPKLKEQYMDKGKVYYIFREFPLDPLSKGAFMLSRCLPKERYFPMIDVLFERQREWAYVKKPLPALMTLAKQAGFTEESFKACLTNQDIQAGIEAVVKQASDKLDVNSTPTFFVNGKKHAGDISFKELSKIIDEQ